MATLLPVIPFLIGVVAKWDAWVVTRDEAIVSSSEEQIASCRPTICLARSPGIEIGVEPETCFVDFGDQKTGHAVEGRDEPLMRDPIARIGTEGFTVRHEPIEDPDVPAAEIIECDSKC